MNKASLTSTEQNLGRRLHRVEEAGGYISVSASKMRQLGRTGEIPYVQERDGALMLFDKADLDRWIESHKKAA